MSSLTGKVQTVIGPIEPSELGMTLIHEHLFVDLRKAFQEPADPWKKALAHSPINLDVLGWILANPHSHLTNLLLKDIGLAIDEVSKFKTVGGGTIVDVSNADIGRYPLGLKMVAERTGLNVVCGTGHYVDAYHPPNMNERSVEDLKEEMVRDVMEGIDSTEIKAGILGEIGNTSGFGGCWTENEKKVCRAAVRAQENTGASIYIHPGRSREAPIEILQFLREEEANLERVVMGHLHRTINEIKEFEVVANYGCYLAIDEFGCTFTYSPMTYSTHFPVPHDEGMCVLVRDLIDAGYLDQIVISNDICYQIRLTKFGGHGYAHIIKNIIPHLKELGVTNKEIKMILVENPKKILTFIS
jgi:phosphotriesterase-related protein